MAFDVKLPDLGDGIESGDVLEIYVTVGQTVTKEQGLLELETDKATVTVPSPKSGKVSKILVSPGQSVPIGSIIVQLELEEAGKPAEASKPSAPQVTNANPPTPAVKTPPAPVAATQTAAIVTPQASVSAQQTTPSPAPAHSAKAPAARSNVSVSMSVNPAASISSTTDSPSATQAITSQRDSSLEGSNQLVAASPAVRRFAREVGVDLAGVDGSGEGGRISREDVLRAVREASSRAASQKTVATTADSPKSVSTKESLSSSASGTSGALETVSSLPGTPSQSEYGPIRSERLSKIRKTIASQMHKSWTTAPQVTNFDDADVTELEAIRVSSKDDYAARGIKLTSLPFLMKAVATALRNHPLVNATLDLENEQIVYHDYVNLGVAVDTPRGLVVPNIRNAHLMSIPDIAKALAEMANRVRNGDFTVGELRGGTFTLSNLGAIGGTYSTPIVNVPEVAILLVGRTRKLPVVMQDDSIKVRQMMPLSLTYDHRLIDGGTAARFLNDVISLLESPSRLLLAIS